jgi:hypothetical protein
MKPEERIKAILQKALNEFISLDHFYELCEDEWEKNSLFNAILDNIESLIEHSPHNDFEKQKEMKEYKIMRYDLKLLEQIESSNPDYLLSKRTVEIKRL